MRKNQPKIDDFQPAQYKEYGKNFTNFFGWQILIWLSEDFTSLQWFLFVLAWV